MSMPVVAGGKKLIYRLLRYEHEEPVQCPYCLQLPSIGDTSYGSLGCTSCQTGVDVYIQANFQVFQVVPVSQYEYEED